MENLYKNISKNKMSKWGICKLVIKVFKYNIFLILFFGVLDICFKIGNSFILQKVIKSIIDSDKN